MDNMTILAIAIGVLALVAAVWMVNTQRRRSHLRARFGPEYDRVVHDVGSRGRAERRLIRREERVRKLAIHPLTPAEGARFAEEWRQVQSRFVDSPAAAVADADRLVTEVMRARGYPVGDFEQRAADVSVDHPRVVSNYRAARLISDRNRLGQATTEDLRQAMVHYRALFDDLLETHASVEREVRVETT